MRVTKRSGAMEDVDLGQIQSRIASLSGMLRVDAPLLAQRTVASLTDGVTTSFLDHVAADAAIDLYTLHTDYERLAVRLKVDNMHKTITRSFSETVAQLHADGRLSDTFCAFVQAHGETLDGMICRDRDFDLSFFGFNTLVNNKYLMRSSSGEVAELPSYMWLRVAVTIHMPDISSIRKHYDTISRLEYTHATPTLFNCGARFNNQFASCFLMQLCDDSVEGIYKSLTECASISKAAGGIGLHMHNLRGHGSVIKSTGCTSEGLIPTLRVFNESSKLVKQAGKRPGSIAIYISPDHCDIQAFLDMRRNKGDESAKCRELFSALWIPDLFMRAVIDDRDWHLFSPDTAPGLADVCGDDYVVLYNSYVSRGIQRRTIRARALWQNIIEAQIETGTPYMLYKDAVNKHNMQSHIGVVRSSNLCCEITEVSDTNTIAVCNLASICLPKFLDADGQFNFHRLEQCVHLAVRSLDNVIDRTHYPLEKAKRSNLSTRPLGLGVQGWQSLLIAMRLPFDSEAAKKLNREVFAAIYYFAWSQSAALAVEKGAYELFDGSPLSKGILHADTFEQNLPERFDWDALRERVRAGTRHSLITCVMPTASTSQIAGNTEACEPLTSNIYVRSTQAGDYVQVNRQLVEDLQSIGKWTSQTKDDIIKHDGSVQQLDIPADLKLLYRTAYEISQRAVIDQAADRQPFIDQSQSMNLFLRAPTIEQVSSMHIYAFKKGLKTGQYYLRTRPRARAVQLAMQPAETLHSAPPIACEGCSA